jgi:hypothetical protein
VSSTIVTGAVVHELDLPARGEPSGEQANDERDHREIDSYDH